MHGSTKIVLCVGGGYRIMLVICKVLVFTTFYFYEPFYFYVNYFTRFCFCRNKQRGWFLVQMEWQTYELQEITFFGNWIRWLFSLRRFYTRRNKSGMPRRHRFFCSWHMRKSFVYWHFPEISIPLKSRNHFNFSTPNKYRFLFKPIIFVYSCKQSELL